MILILGHQLGKHGRHLGMQRLLLVIAQRAVETLVEVLHNLRIVRLEDQWVKSVFEAALQPNAQCHIGRQVRLCIVANILLQLVDEDGR